MTDFDRLNHREFWKHPNATVPVTISFVDVLGDDEMAVNVQWVALGLTIVAQQMAADERVMVAWIAGGFTLTRYTVMCAVLTSKARTLKRDAFLHVSDTVPMPEMQP